MFDTPQSWKMSEPEKIVAIIKEVECWRLGNWGGCCCSHFSIRNVDIDISCGKGREQAVWIGSPSMDYWNGVSKNGNDENLLRPIMEEVVRQLTEQSGRGGTFAQYFHKWEK